MNTEIRSRQRRGRGGVHRLIAAAAVLPVVLLAACSGSGSSTESTSAAESATSAAPQSEAAESASAEASSAPASESADTAAILQTAFLVDDVDPASLEPLILQGLTEAGAPATDEQIQLAFDCNSQQECKIGDGEKTLGILLGSGTNVWMQLSRASVILQAITQYPEIGTVISLSAGGDQQAFSSHLQTLITKGVDAIVTYDDFGPAMTAGFQEATDAGIPVVAFGGTPGPDATSAVVSQVQSDFCEAGKSMAIKAAEMLDNKGNIAYFTGTPGNPQGEGWQTCATEWFEANAPDMQVVNKSNTDWSSEGTVKAASALIASGQAVDLIMYDYAHETANIVSTYEKAKLPVPDQITWTVDNTLSKLWEEGQASDNPWKLAETTSLNWEGNLALTAAMAKIAGQEVPPFLIFPLPFADAQMGDYKPDLGAAYPGPTLMPDKLLELVLAANE